MADITQPTTSEEGSRAVLLGTRPVETVVPRKRYAVIVGISKYKDPNLNLRYAHRDAEELDKLIRTPRSGGFPADNIKTLIDEEATTSNITKALRSFLQKPGEEDLVLVYLACHGAPDPNRPQNVYLITSDTDPLDIPGTALPMSDIQRDLERNLLAKRVVLIADTCHSGAVGDSSGRRSGIDESAAATRYLQSLGQSKPGMAILTSAEVSETSREDARWGGGHGVFTWHLLEGLRGKAEDNKGKITIGGLFDYVREQVRLDTGDQQHPVIGSTAFDRDLPLAVTGDISTSEYFQLGRALLDVGWLLDDKERFASAERQLREARRLAGELGQPLPAAQFYIGQTQLARGDAAGALAALGQIAEGLSDELIPEAAFCRVMAHAVAGDAAATATALTTFRQAHPVDWRTGWLAELGEALDRERQASTGHALLIGINEYADPKRIPSLRGPTNDIALAQEMLVTHFAFDPDRIVRLENAKATRQGIFDALERLASESDSRDRVVVWYSGHAISQGVPAYLLPHDYNANDAASGITAEEWHIALKKIPAYRKLVVLDTHGRQEMFDLAAEEAYLLALAENRPSQTAQEKTINGTSYGLFSYELTQAIARNPQASLDEIGAAVIQAVETGSNGRQTPCFIGDGRGAFLESTSWRLFAEAFAFSQRRNFEAFTLEELEMLENRFSQAGLAIYPPLLHSLGRGYLEKEAFPLAQKKLEKARKQATALGLNDAELPFSLAIAQLRSHHYADALQTLQEYRSTLGEGTELDAKVAVVEKLTTHRLHALLVGVGKQANPDLAGALGAPNDVEDMHRLLLEKLGAHEENIVTLVNEKATGEAIRQHFRQLLEIARNEPALFFFAGNGSLSYRGEPTILPYDARDARIPNDILLNDLAQHAARYPDNLVTLVDAGWAPGDKLPWGAPSHSRFVSADMRPMGATRAVSLGRQPEQKSSGLYGDVQPWQMDPELQQIRQQVGEQIGEQGLGIGRTTFYPSSFQAVFTQDGLPPGIGVAEAEFPSPLGDGPSKPRGALTFTFVQAVLKRLAGSEETTRPGHMPEPITYADLCSTIASHLKWLQPFFIGVRPTECIFSNVVQEEGIQNAIRNQIFEQPLHRAAQLLERLLDRRKGEDMEAWLNLGVIQAAKGEYAASVRSLQEAIKLEENGAPELCHEAHYHLGRVMTITASAPTPPALSIGYGEERPGNLDTAISELRDAIRGNPGNAAAYYYLGQAIFTRMQQEQIVEVEQSWQKYLELGATVGRKNEIRQQLATLRSSAMGTGSGLEKKPWSGKGTGAG